jgi:hypothetical protein
VILPGFTGSSHISISVNPNTSCSTIALSSVYRLGLLPIFDKFGCHSCEVTLSVPTRSGFYTSKFPPDCLHTLGDADITLGSEWVSDCSIALYEDGSGLEDPSQLAISSLSANHHWNTSNGMSPPSRSTNNSPVAFADAQVDEDHVDVNIVLWKLNSCFNNQSFDTSAFSAIHDMEPDDMLLTRENVMSHFLNGRCASRKAPGCSELSHSVRSPVKMALAVTLKI